MQLIHNGLCGIFAQFSVVVEPRLEPCKCERGISLRLGYERGFVSVSHKLQLLT